MFNSTLRRGLQRPSRASPPRHLCCAAHLGHVLQDVLHILLKAHVEHLVGLVQHDETNLLWGGGGRVGRGV